MQTIALVTGGAWGIGAAIARGANERQVENGAKVASGLAGQIREPKAVTTAALAQVGNYFKELEQSRQTVLAEAKSAFEEWQTEVGDLMSPETVQEQMALALPHWSKFVLAPFELRSKTGTKQTAAAATLGSKPAQAAPTTEKQG